MTFLIDCTTPNQRQRWLLRNGEAARFGSSPWVEFCIEDDTALSPEHFLVSYSNGLVLHAIDDAFVEMDGTQITTTKIESGSKVRVGQSTIQFMQVHARSQSETTTTSTTPATVVLQAPKSTWESKAGVAELVSLSNEAVAAIAASSTPLVAIDALVAKELDEDAVRLLAGCLPVLLLIRWVSQTLQHHGIAIDDVKKQRAIQWLNAPSEPLRVEIESAIQWSDNASPWTWVFASISWTAGIKQPLSELDVASTPKMIVSSMIAALQLASCQTDKRLFRKDCIARGFQYLVASQRGEGNAASSPTQ